MTVLTTPTRNVAFTSALLSLLAMAACAIEPQSECRGDDADCGDVGTLTQAMTGAVGDTGTTEMNVGGALTGGKKRCLSLNGTKSTITGGGPDGATCTLVQELSQCEYDDGKCTCKFEILSAAGDCTHNDNPASIGLEPPKYLSL